MEEPKGVECDGYRYKQCGRTTMVERMQFPCGGWVLTWGIMLSIVGFFLLMGFRWVHNVFVVFVLVFLRDWRVILIF